MWPRRGFFFRSIAAPQFSHENTAPSSRLITTNSVCWQLGQITSIVDYAAGNMLNAEHQALGMRRNVKKQIDMAAAKSRFPYPSKPPKTPEEHLRSEAKAARWRDPEELAASRRRLGIEDEPDNQNNQNEETQVEPSKL